MSMGVDHENAPKKRFSWALVSGKDLNLIFMNRNNIIGEISNEFVFKLYSKGTKEVKIKKIEIKNSSDGRYTLRLEKLFPNYKNS